MADYDRPESPVVSEMCWGQGMVPPIGISYDPDGTVSRFPQARPQGVGLGTSDENWRDKVAGMRSNTTDDSETIDEMYTAAGNPDRYGPAPALVREPDVTLAPDPQLEPVVRFERKE